MSPSAFTWDTIIFPPVRILLLPWLLLGAQGPQEVHLHPQPLTHQHTMQSLLLWGLTTGTGGLRKDVWPFSLCFISWAWRPRSYSSRGLPIIFSRVWALLAFWIQSQKQITIAFDFCCYVSLKEVAQESMIHEQGGKWRIYSEKKMTCLCFQNIIQTDIFSQPPSPIPVTPGNDNWFLKGNSSRWSCQWSYWVSTADPNGETSFRRISF